jgi:hypothetical protein
VLIQHVDDLEHALAERAEHHCARVVLRAVDLLVFLCLGEVRQQLQWSAMALGIIPTSSSVFCIFGCLSAAVFPSRLRSIAFSSPSTSATTRWNSML